MVVDLDELILLNDRLGAKALRRQVHTLSIIEAALQSLYESPNARIDGCYFGHFFELGLPALAGRRLCLHDAQYERHDEHSKYCHPDTVPV